MLEKARQAERLTAERDAAQERYERYRDGGHRPRRDRRARAHAPVARRRSPVLRPSVERLRAVDAKIGTLAGACSRARSRSTSRSRPRSAGGRCRAGRSCWSSIGLAIAVVSFVAAASPRSSTSGRDPDRIGGIVAGDRARARRRRLVAAPRRSRPTSSLRDVEVDRRLRGRSEIEQELREAQAEHDDLLQRLGLDRVRRRPRSGCALEEAHVAEIEPAARAPVGPDRRREARRAARPARHRRARDRAEDGRARGAGADRQGAAGPRAPRGRGRGRRAPARPRAATTRRTRGRASSRTRSTPRRSPRSPSAWPAGQEELSALRRRERVYARTLLRDQHRRAGDDAARHALPRAAHGRRPRADHRRPLPPRPGRRQRTSGSTCLSPERDDWVPVTDLSQGTLDVVYLAARIGLVRLVTGDRRPPLVLDDPFVTLDDARAAAGARAAARGRARLPGHLPHDVGPLRRAGRQGHRRSTARPPPTATREPRRRPLPDLAGPGRGPRPRPRLARSAGGRATSAADSLTRRAPLSSASCSGRSSSACSRPSRSASRAASRFPQGADVAWAVAAGVFGVVGITSLYRGLAVGRMGVVAPTTGVLAAVVPVVGGVRAGGRPADRGRRRDRRRAARRRARHAGARPRRLDAVGDRVGPARRRWRSALFNVCIGQLSGAGAFGPLVIIRLVQAGILLAIIVARAPGVADAARDVPPSSSSSACWTWPATPRSSSPRRPATLAIAATLSSLYPVGTVILAIAVLHERLTRSHVAGIVLTAAAILLIGLGTAGS